MLAINNGDVPTIQAFVETGSILRAMTKEERVRSPNYRRSPSPWDPSILLGKRPLQRAIELGKVDICLQLLGYVPSLRVGAFMVATRAKQLDIVRALLNFDGISGTVLRNALLIAIENGHEAMEGMLKGAIGKEWNDESFFHQIIRNSSYHTVQRSFAFFDKALLSSGFDAAIQACQFETALGILRYSSSIRNPIPLRNPGMLIRYAAQKSNPLLYELLERGIHPDTPVTHWPDTHPQAYTAPDVRRHCYYPTPKDYFNGTPLALAAGRDQNECVKALIFYGADVNAEDGLALRRAAKFSRSDTVMTLLRAGADVRRSTALFLAAVYGQGYEEGRRPMLSKRMIEYCTVADVTGALSEAIRNKSVRGVRELLENTQEHNRWVEGRDVVDFEVRCGYDEKLFRMGSSDVLEGYWKRTDREHKIERLSPLIVPTTQLITEAMRTNHDVSVHLLVDHFYEGSFDTLVQDSAIVAALFKAAERGYYKVIKKLLRLEHRADGKRAARLLLGGMSVRDVLQDPRINVRDVMCGNYCTRYEYARERRRRPVYETERGPHREGDSQSYSPTPPPDTSSMRWGWGGGSASSADENGPDDLEIDGTMSPKEPPFWDHGSDADDEGKRPSGFCHDGDKEEMQGFSVVGNGIGEEQDVEMLDSEEHEGGEDGEGSLQKTETLPQISYRLAKRKREVTENMSDGRG
ncbi:hypothetical protein HDV00_001454 [Rhizophlyctis rosea]|nr:hypothetical protein HDV00_001454 [Rhizophlyctis rosea]